MTLKTNLKNVYVKDRQQLHLFQQIILQTVSAASIIYTDKLQMYLPIEYYSKLCMDKKQKYLKRICL